MAGRKHNCEDEVIVGVLVLAELDEDEIEALKRGSMATTRNARNPKGKHISCGTEITAKECRQLQHVYESARDRGYSPERAAKQAWGSLRNPPDPTIARAHANRMMNGAGLGGFLGSLAGVVIGLPFGQPLLSVLLSTAGGAAGARYAAKPDRKERATVGGGVGGVFGPLFAALGGYIGGRHPDKKNNPQLRASNPSTNARARRIANGGL